ncbi:MAG: SDR family oxidoreductase [Kiloniellaceae bacterium]
MSDAPLLLTGASGFIGAWILRRAVELKRPIVACDLAEDRRRLAQILPGSAETSLITWESLDVTDAEAVEALVERHDPAAILHLAALQIPDCAAKPRLGAEVNVLGHLNILEAARRRGGLPVVYGSSAAAKPRGPEQAPANLYGIYKKAGEEMARIYWRDHGVPSLGLRPYIVYGIGRDQGETSALTRAMQAAALGESYEIPFTGRFSFQYAGDVAEIFIRCATSDIEGALTSDISARLENVDDVVAAIQTAVPAARITVAEHFRQGPEEGFDTTAIERLLGAPPATPLAAGVKATIDSFRRIAAATPA